MKISAIILTIIIVTSSSGISQAIQSDKNKAGCDFLNAIKYKNNADTITIKARYLSMGKIGQDDMMQELKKYEKIRVKDFQYAIEFQPENCSSIYYMPCKDESIADQLYFLPEGERNLMLTCIFLKGHDSYFKQPFFLIDKVVIVP